MAGCGFPVELSGFRNFCRELAPDRNMVELHKIIPEMEIRFTAVCLPSPKHAIRSGDY
jgi:hypothetical protein